MASEAFCSLCGLKFRIVELFVCRECGVLICPICLNRSRGWKNLDGNRCSCGSTEVRSVGDLRNWITSELLALRKRLKKATYRPVILYQRWERIYDEMILLSKFFVVHSLQLREAIEVITRNEPFIVENAREFAFKFKAELDRLAQSKAYQIDVLLRIRTHVGYLQKQVEVFDAVLKEKLIVAENDISRAEEILVQILGMKQSLEKLSSVLKTQPGEMVIGIIPDIRLHGSRNKVRKGLVFISNKRIRVAELISSRFPLNKGPRIAEEFSSTDILSLVIRKRRFRGSVLDVYTSLGHRYFTGSLNTLQNLQNYLKRSISGDGSTQNIHSRTSVSQKNPWKVSEFKKRISRILSLKDLFRNSNSLPSLNKSFLDSPQINEPFLSDLLNKKHSAQRLLHTLKESLALGCIEPEDYYFQKDKIEEKIQKIEDNLLSLNNSETNFSISSW